MSTIKITTKSPRVLFGVISSVIVGLLTLLGPLIAQADSNTINLAEVTATVIPTAAQSTSDEENTPDARALRVMQLHEVVRETEEKYGENSEAVFQVLQNFSKLVVGCKSPRRDLLNPMPQLEDQERATLISVLQRAIPLARKLRGDKHIETGKLLATYGACLELEKQDAQAEPLLDEALTILGVNGSVETDNKRLVALDALVRIYERTNRIERALVDAQFALSIRKRTLPANHSDITLTLDHIESLKKSLRLQVAATTHKSMSDASLEMSLINQLSDLDKQSWEKNYLKKNKRLDLLISYIEHALPEKERTLGLEHREVTDMRATLTLFYAQKRQFEKTREIYKRELSILEKLSGPEQSLTGIILIGIGHTYLNMGQYDQALPFYQKGLANLEKTTGLESNYTAIGLDSLANLYTSLGQYGEALRLYKRSVAILDKNLEPERAKSVNCVGHTGLATLYARLGQYDKSLQLAQCGSEVTKQVWGPENPITAVSDAELVGMSYRATGQYDKALLAYQRRLTYFENEHGPEDLARATSLIELGELYQTMRQYTQALNYYRQGLTIREKLLGALHPETASSLQNLGSIYIALGQLDEAENLLQDIVTRILGNPAARETLWKTQRDLSILYAKKQIPDLAILWGKEAINTIQSLRGEVIGLDQELRSSFLNDKRPVYQNLADLLIAEGRLIEAQVVLQMLKEQELHDDLQRSAQSNPQVMHINFTGLEHKRFAKYYEMRDKQTPLINEWEQLLRKQSLSEITSQEQKRLTEIETKLMPPLRAALRKFFAELQKQSDTFAKGKDYRKNDLNAQQVETNLQKVFSAIRKTDPSARIAALQYVVTDTRLSILLSTPNTPPLARQIDFDGKILRTQLVKMLTLLGDKDSDNRVKTTLADLYAQLIAPISKDLKATGATTLIFVPNDVLRYVPFAALYDGNQYLIQNYSLVTFNEAVKKEFTTNTRATWKLAAMGLTQAVTETNPPLPPLKKVPQELTAITTKVGLTGLIYLDKDFNRVNLMRSLSQDFNVLHLATHFIFVPGRPDASRLFLGDRSSLYLSEIARNNLRFDHFNLVTFAACESGLGGGLDADGREMESLGALVQNQGAQSVMTTLWKINDGSTAEFMEAFYRARSQKQLSKADALRSAQLKLIAGGGVYARPYYWAPFVLMGDWH